MTDPNRLTLFYSPQTRATGMRVLLEELGAPYELHVLNMKAGEQRQPGYLAVNPLGKVPAIRRGDALVTEQVAITIYLADLFPQAGLAPALDDPLRGPYLRWIAYYGSTFEPAVVDRFMQREPGPVAMSPYADYDTMLGALEAQLATGPYLFGDRFTAADVLWGIALDWTLKFGLVPKRDVFVRYAERLTARPAFQRVSAADVEMAAQHAAAAG
ncbi:MAG: glutathione S-transferase family protein [Rhodopseudomonas palustris]|uniref:Glutathione S-transferase family protein n=1 Tax=Rhodopseudomonas palustris TaxID=1076 RepID=A0A933S082_RHOPL|nr:glutathione S-transferase family protein [Rhodopseudomonas palustris]